MSTFRVDLKPPEPRASNLFWLHQIRSQVSRKLMNTLSPVTAVIKYQSVWLGSWNSNNSDHKLLMWVQTCQKTMNTSYTVPTTDLAGFAWFCYIFFLGWPWGQQNPKSGSSTDAQVVDLDDALGSTNFMQNPQAAEAPKKTKFGSRSGGCLVSGFMCFLVFLLQPIILFRGDDAELLTFICDT